MYEDEDALIAIRCNIFTDQWLSTARISDWLATYLATVKYSIRNRLTNAAPKLLRRRDFALAAKIFKNEDDLSLAKKLIEGCLWAYEVMPWV